MEMLEAGLGPGPQGAPRTEEEVSWAGSQGEAGCLTRAKAQVYGVDALLVAPDHSCPGSGQQPGLQPPSGSLNASRSGAWPACSSTCVSRAGLSLLISAAEARSGPSQDHRVFPGGRPAHTALGSVGLSSSLHTVITGFNYSHHATLQLTPLGLLKLWNSPPPQAPAHTS